MSNEETKKRTSARLSVGTLDKLEEYQHENNLDNRSAAIEHIVEHRDEMERTTDRWEMIAQQALYAVTFSMMVSVIATVSFIVAYIQVGYPSPWTVISFSVLMGGLLAAVGGSAGYKYSTAKVETRSFEVEA